MKPGIRHLGWLLVFAIVVLTPAKIFGFFDTGIIVLIGLGIFLLIHWRVEVVASRIDEKRKVHSEKEKFLERKRKKELEKKWDDEFEEKEGNRRNIRDFNIEDWRK